MPSYRIVSTDSPSMQRVLRVLVAADEPIDGHQIADLACIAFNTFQNGYRHLLMGESKIHIAGWRHNSRGPFVPLYRAGPGVAPPKPEKIDQLARSRNWKHRTGYNEARKAQRRLARPKDQVLAALLGLPTRYQKRPMAHNQEKTA